MKNFKVLLQNACEDYLTHLDHEPNLEDIAEMCSTDIADVVWKALAFAQENRKSKEENGYVSSRKALTILKKFAEGIMNKPVGSCVGTLKCLFRDAKNYGFEFWYGTKAGMHYKLEHIPEDWQHIIAYGFIKK